MIDSATPVFAVPPINDANRSKESVDSLTSCRGILSLWVVLVHFGDAVFTLVPGLRFLSPLAARGSMAVPAFFVLSGWVISYNYSNWFGKGQLSGSSFWKFLALRLARIYPVHIATLLVVLVMVLVSASTGVGRPGNGYDTVDFTLNVFLIHAWLPHPSLSWNFPAWTISSEWFAYLLFPLFAMIFHRHVRSNKIAWGVGLTALTLTVIHLQFWPFAPFQAILLVIPNFIAGMAIHWTSRLGGSNSPPRWLPDLLVVVVAASCYLPWIHASTFVLSAIPAVVIFSLSRLGAHCTSIWKSAWLVFLGEVSYSLYLSHAVTAKIVLTAFPPVTWSSHGPLKAWAAVGIYAIAVPLATWACYALIERPARRALRTKLKSWSIG